MIRLVSASLALTAAITGCSVDVESIKQEAEKLQKDIDSSNLKDCKDEEGNPLPEWICRKDAESEAKKPEWKMLKPAKLINSNHFIV